MSTMDSSTVRIQAGLECRIHVGNFEWWAPVSDQGSKSLMPHLVGVSLGK